MKQTNIYSHKGRLKEITIREYPYSSAGEIAARHGVCSGSVWYWVKKLNLQQTDETKAGYSKRHGVVSQTQSRQISRSNERAWKRKSAHDDGAVPCNVGDASEDKIAHCDATHQGVQGDMYLVNMRNYFRDIEVGGRFTLYYDEQTKRSGKEDYYTKSCGLTFEQVRN